MSDASERTLEFQCPKCAKRLKASAKAAGKKFNCPACGQPVKVPGLAPIANQDDDWMNLDAPPTQPVRSAAPKSLTPSSPSNSAANSSSKPAAKPAAVSQSNPTSAKRAEASNSIEPSAKSTAPEEPKRSIFDDDLPQLAELEQAAPRPTMPDLLGVDLEELVPVNPKPATRGSTAPPNRASGSSSSDGAKANKPAVPKKAALDPANAQYRCACPSCGTPQYVTLARQGKQVRCPDCFAEFKIPPPPPGWTPTTPAHVQLSTNLVAANTDDTKQYRSNADDLLRSAEKELDDDDIDSMYDMDFDNATFMRRTFGFFLDPTAMFQIVIFSLFFALLFAAEFYCLAKSQENRAYMLISALPIPLMALIIAFPMFGTGAGHSRVGGERASQSA